MINFSTNWNPKFSYSHEFCSQLNRSQNTKYFVQAQPTSNNNVIFSNFQIIFGGHTFESIYFKNI